jgi:predicted dehydrogenase
MKSASGKVRIGIIGAGGIAAKLHLPELSKLADRCEVSLIGGRKDARLRLLCDKFGVARYTHNYEDVIADDRIDAVLIATPHPRHVAWGIRALEAGKHVLVEKPLCADMTEADSFVAAVEKSERTALCLPHFSPAVYAIRRGIRAGDIGRVSGARARTSHGGPEVYYKEVRDIFGETDEDLWFFDARRATVGALFDMGVYAVAQLVALLGTARRVTAIATTFDKPTTLEDSATLILQMENGAVATAETSWCDAARTWELSVHGTSGKYVMPNADGTSAMYYAPLSHESDHASIKASPVEGDHNIGGIHAHFLDCIARSTQPPLSHAHAARHVTEILLAGLKSARTGCAVNVSSTAEAQLQINGFDRR